MDSFSYRHTVRFSEVDPAGVAFFSRFFEWAHHAWEALLHQVEGPDWYSSLSRGKWGLPLAAASARYRRPARLGDVIVIRPALVAHDTRRVTFEFRMQSEDGAEFAVIQHEHAFIDLKQFRPIDGDPRFAERLLAGGLHDARPPQSDPDPAP